MAEINYTVSSSLGLDWLLLWIELPGGSRLYIQPRLSPRHATALMMMHEPKRASLSKKKKNTTTQTHAANAYRWEQGNKSRGNKRVKWILAARENRLWKLISEFPAACATLPTTQSPFCTSPFSFRSFMGFKRRPHTSRRLCWRTDGAESKCVSRATETPIRWVEGVKTIESGEIVALSYKVREIVPCSFRVFASLCLLSCYFVLGIFQVLSVILQTFISKDVMEPNNTRKALQTQRCIVGGKA